MPEYIKFWLAKELIPLAIFIGLAALLFGFVTLMWLYGKIRNFWRSLMSRCEQTGEQ